MVVPIKVSLILPSIVGSRPWLSSSAGPCWSATPTTSWTEWSTGKRSPRRCSCARPGAPRQRCSPSWWVSSCPPSLPLISWRLPKRPLEQELKGVKGDCGVNSFLSSSPPDAAITGLAEARIAYPLDKITWQFTGVTAPSARLKCLKKTWHQDISPLFVADVRIQASGCSRVECKMSFQSILLPLITRTPKRSSTRSLKTATRRRCTNCW